LFGELSGLNIFVVIFVRGKFRSVVLGFLARTAPRQSQARKPVRELLIVVPDF